MLNFDPHLWLSEHVQPKSAPPLAGLATLARAAHETEKVEARIAPAKAAKAANVGSCEAPLAGLKPNAPLHGLDASRWGELLRDADWLLENFTRQAARDGWSAADLFGVLPGHDGWGGVADRLRGSRSLVMTADLACWRRMHTGTPDSFARGASLMPWLVLLWDQGSGTCGATDDYPPQGPPGGRTAQAPNDALQLAVRTVPSEGQADPCHRRRPHRAACPRWQR
jgi:hypothetical protein